jgi:hypothetical protein
MSVVPQMFALLEVLPLMHRESLPRTSASASLNRRYPAREMVSRLFLVRRSALMQWWCDVKGTKNAFFVSEWWCSTVNFFVAFILYRQHHQQAIISRNPGLNNPDISKIIGEQWKAEGEESKKVWQDLAQVGGFLHFWIFFLTSCAGRENQTSRTIPRLPLPATSSRQTLTAESFGSTYNCGEVSLSEVWWT